MSQNEDQPALGSEDIFNTEELLQAEEEFANIENAREEPPPESMDFGEIIGEPDSENHEAVNGMIEDTDEAPADDLEDNGTEIVEDQGKLIGVHLINAFTTKWVFFLESKVIEGAQEASTKPVKKTASNQDKLTELPLSKVKHIIKLDPEVNLVNGEIPWLLVNNE